MGVRKLQIAVSGLGRMGRRHALHFLERTPRADLVAAFCPVVEEEIAWANQNLVPFGVKLYHDYDELLRHTGLEAVVVSTATTVHAEQAIKAINADKHVLCEKPLGTTVEGSQSVVDAAATKPHLKVMCGFSRRFDDSYRDAHRRVTNGDIGAPAILRSQTCDKLDPTGFFVEYAAFSGGIFVDCNIHDIDLALWFFGEDSKVKSVTAVGVTAVEPDLAKHGDVDNGVGVVEFYDNKIAYFYSSRIMAAGQHDMTEIIGTKGKIAVNANPQLNLVELSEPTGIRREIPAHYYGRFEQAFVVEANEFTRAVLEDTPVPVSLIGAVKAVRIGCALQESLRSGLKIWFDEQGNRVEKL